MSLLDNGTIQQTKYPLTFPIRVCTVNTINVIEGLAISLAWLVTFDGRESISHFTLYLEELATPLIHATKKWECNRSPELLLTAANG